jgi:heat shock protein HslJ
MKTGLFGRAALASCLCLVSTAALPQSLEGRYWKAVELVGKPAPAQDARREAHLIFASAGSVSGSDGCNRMSGTYELKGDAIKFGQMMGTLMACPNTGDVDRLFREALASASRLSVVGDRLELFDASGKRVALFAGRTQGSAGGLDNTSWQLVKFQGGDGTTLTPDDGGKYTIEFAGGGQLNARIDCNRGRGTWKSAGSSQLELGPLALTRALCPPGSMHDHIAKQWSFVRSYVLRDGHLFLSLMADGGIYEFQPLSKPKQ